MSEEASVLVRSVRSVDDSDETLLRAYVRKGSEEAFATLVQRHCNLVFAAARRVSGNPAVAEDVTQSVFVDLARKAVRLPRGTILAGWLYRAACHAASNHLRSESRRRQREHWAMANQESRLPEPDRSEAIAALQPLLDAALNDLPPDDRSALVLRFLAARSLAEVGRGLGITEDAAQKRVSRALDRLRAAFRARGAQLNHGLLIGALTVASSEAAPPSLIPEVLRAGTASLAASVGNTTPLPSLVLMKSKTAVALVAGAILTTALLIQTWKLRGLRAEYDDLQARHAASAAPAERPASPRANDSSPEQLAELLRLRAEVARLRTMAGTGVPTPDAGVRAARAQTAAVKEEIEFRGHRAQVIEAGKLLGLATRMFMIDHAEQLPSSWEQLRDHDAKILQPKPDGGFPTAVVPEDFEFFPQPRPPNIQEPNAVLFREKRVRAIPPAALSEEELARAGLADQPLRRGFERSYIMMDGSVQTPSSPDGNFEAFEAEGTVKPSP